MGKSKEWRRIMDTSELALLLDEALKKIGPSIISKLPGNMLEKYSAFLNYLDKDNGNIKEPITQYVSGQKELKIFNDTMMNQGFSRLRISFNTLTCWLLLNSIENGIPVTLSNLQNYLSLDFTPAHNILVMSGIEIDKKIEISNNIVMVPFEDIPDSFSKYALTKHFPNTKLSATFVPIYNLPKVALMADIELKPKFIDHSAKLQKNLEINEFDASREQLFEICQFFTLATPNSCLLPIAEWCVFNKQVPLYGMLPDGYSGTPNNLINNTTCKVKGADITDFCDIYKKYLGLSRQKEKNLLKISIRRLNQAKGRQELEDKVVDLSIALEVLLLNDRSSNDPISFPFRLRGACFLADTYKEREGITKILKTLYEYRCNVVHSGKLEKNNFTNEIIENSIKLCIKIIKKVISNGGFPEWDRLVLGEQK